MVALNLDKLVENEEFKSPRQREITRNSRFAALFPQATKVKKHWYDFFGTWEDPKPLTKEQIREILVAHNLVEGDPDIAVDKALSGHYLAGGGSPDAALDHYRFEESTDEKGCKLYTFDRYRHPLLF